MLLRALVLGADVQPSTFYDQVTGAEKPGFTVNLSVVDSETYEKYECQLNERFPQLEQIKEMKRQGQPQDVIDQAIEAFKATELPQHQATLLLEVLRFKGKSAAYIKLVCRFAQVAATV